MILVLELVGPVVIHAESERNSEFDLHLPSGCDSRYKYLTRYVPVVYLVYRSGVKQTTNVDNSSYLTEI